MAVLELFTKKLCFVTVKRLEKVVSKERGNSKMKSVQLEELITKIWFLFRGIPKAYCL